MPGAMVRFLYLLVAFAMASQALARTATTPTEVPSLAPVIEKVLPGVVSIAVHGRVASQQNPLLNDPFFRRFFGVPDDAQPPVRQFQAAGSGVIVDAGKGYVITNHHVVQNADEITVTLADGRRLPATRIGTDPGTDVALLQIAADRLTALPLGDSDQLKVGDYVIAVGNPFGLNQTVTLGIVSALGRTGLGIEGYEDFIQTDASINPGNSGGALVDLRGQLVGINSAIIGPAGGNVGIGFAIPINMAKTISEELVARGEVRRGQLGVLAQDLTPELADSLGITATQGALVANVVPGSAAEAAGLKPGDVIIAIDGRPVRNAGALRSRIGTMRQGSKVDVTYIRGNQEKTVSAEIRAQSTSSTAPTAAAGLDGVSLTAIPPDHPAAGRVEGVLVASVQPDSAAGRAGLREGDIIMSVNQQPVRNPDDIAAAAGAGTLLLHVARGDGALFIVIR
jgi:serine protease Do/serine protease DegQ